MVIARTMEFHAIGHHRQEHRLRCLRNAYPSLSTDANARAWLVVSFSGIADGDWNTSSQPFSPW